jgi:glutathione S-transferase
MVGRLGLAPDHPVEIAVQGRLDRVMALVEACLGEVNFLAGDESRRQTS